MRRLRDDPDLARTLGQRASASVVRFGPELAAESLVQVYAEVVQQPR